MTTVEELRDKQIESLDRRVSESYQDLKDDIRELRQDIRGNDASEAKKTGPINIPCFRVI